MGRLFSVLIGFIWACLIAGLTKSFFAETPAELASLPPDVAAERMARVVELGIFSGVQSLIFAAPFALVAAAIAEWRRIRSLTFYAVVGVLISLLGFIAHYTNEGTGNPTIANNYALTAFLTAGFLAGLSYWIFAGRSAGGPDVVAPARKDDKRLPVAGKGSASSVPSTGSPKKA